MSEDDVLLALDDAVARARRTPHVQEILAGTEQRLESDSTLDMAWQPLSLDIYGDLPAGILSSWVFALRAGRVTGAERHPNSHQRVMTVSGAADMQTWEDGSWRSNRMDSDNAAPLGTRWLSIPVNVWHRPVISDVANWVVISFHTATADALIEERPEDDEQPDAAQTSAEVYAGRTAR